jgi:hypothetical protein
MKQFILYGAGKLGKRAYNFLKAREMEQIVCCFCDKNYLDLGEIDGKKVVPYDSVKDLGIPFIVTAGNSDVRNEIISILQNDNQTFYEDFLRWMDSYFEDPVEKDRNVIAYCHVDNPYYKDVDNEDSLNIFWGNDSIFFSMFQKLDLQNVIELACGEGRHVSKYIDRAGHVTLVDILKNNLDVCRKRYSGGNQQNFMSKEIFAYMAHKCGFEILEQHIIDWGTDENLYKDLDCITLVQKPMQK